MDIDGIYGLKVVTALDYTSGTADRNGETLDMAGYDGVLAIVKFAAIAAGAATAVLMQYGDASNLSDAADVSGLTISVADDDDNQVFVLDLKNPTKRYVRVKIDKDAANATAESAVYIQYNARNMPVTNTVTDEVTVDRVTGV